MTYAEFMKLSEAERIKNMRRALRASDNLNNKKKLPCQKEIEILNCALRWMGAIGIIDNWEKRVFRKPAEK